MAQARSEAKPNVVFIIVDDQRHDTIRALGNGDIQTPNLDRLVERGVAFTHAHMPSGSHPAICMPSRAMLHSGRTLFHLEGEGQRIPPEHQTLGETLRRAGYQTYGVGKWHNGTEDFNRSFADGAEIFFGGMFDHWNVPVCDYDPSGEYAATVPWIDNHRRFNAVQKLRADRIRAGKHSTELFGGAAREFLERYADPAPYFLYVAFMAPHDPRSMPEEFRALYDADRLPLPEGHCAEHFNFGQREIRDELLAPYPRTLAEVRRHLAEYYAMITHLDREVGRIVDAVEARGELDKTIFVYTADHGLAVGRHGLLGKQNLYDHSIRVPLIFAGPGVPRGERRDALIYTLDAHPTLCDLLGVDVADTVEGRSLTPVMRDAAAVGRERLYFAYADLIRGVRDGRYKLIEYASEHGRATQLFDLVDDPAELRNLSDDPAQQERIAALRQALRQFRDDWDELDHPVGQTFWKRYAD